MVKFPLDLTDSYVRRARLQPAMIVALPLALTTLAWSPSGVAGWSLLWSVFIWCGGTALLAQVGRDAGFKKQDYLYGSWGGKPTTRLLRHHNTKNKAILERRHQKLKVLIGGADIPRPEQEQQDPNAADQIYDMCTSVLLEKTRNKKDFPLVFEENCNYGFRRNLWGMKPLGLGTVAIGMFAVAILFVIDFRHHAVPPASAIISAAVIFLLLLGWLFWFTPDWVKIAADAYAERLLAACEQL